MYGGGRYGNSGSGRAWSSQGRGVRNTSPGFHSFARSGNGARMSGPRGGAMGASRGAGMGSGRVSRIADGNFHSFGGVRTAGFSGNASINHAFVGAGSLNFHGAGWNGGRWGWNGGRWGWGGGWGWGRGWGWGWGGGWGCWGCGLGMGWLGLGRWLESILGLATVLFQSVVVRQPGLP